MASRVNWKGEAVKLRIRTASAAAVNQTMAWAALEAKQNHPGWVYRTGTAERSIQIQNPAAVTGARIVGQWGSVGVNYMRALEFKHGAALRTAADTTYPKLAGEIRRRLG